VTSSPKVQCIKKHWGLDLSISHRERERERVCDKACLPARGSMKVTDIISQSDSQCLTPGYLSAHKLTDRGLSAFSLLPLDYLSLLFTVSPVYHLLNCFGGGLSISMLLRCFSTTIIFRTFVSTPFFSSSVSIPCCVWAQRAVSKGLNWLLNGFHFS